MAERYCELLRGVARHVGLEPESLAATQEIVVDDVAVGFSLTGTDQSAEVAFFATLGAPAEERRAEVYRTMLEANYLWVGTGGATLAVRQDTGDVLLAGRVDLETITAEGLAALLDAFTDAALFWKKYLADEMATAPLEFPSFHMSLRA